MITLLLNKYEKGFNFYIGMLFFLKLETLSQVEEESLLRNDLRPANKLAKGNRLFMRFATKGKCVIWY